MGNLFRCDSGNGPNKLIMPQLDICVPNGTEQGSDIDIFNNQGIIYYYFPLGCTHIHISSIHWVHHLNSDYINRTKMTICGEKSDGTIVHLYTAAPTFGEDSDIIYNVNIPTEGYEKVYLMTRVSSDETDKSVLLGTKCTLRDIVIDL